MPGIESAAPDPVVEHFDGSSRTAQRALVAGLLILGVGVGVLAWLVPDDDVPAAVQPWIAISLVAVFAAASWRFSRMRLELQVDDRGFTVRVRPFRRVRVDAQSVVKAELVEVQPFWEFGGWWDRGLRRNRLLGGTGHTALRVTYLKGRGEREPTTCRLTLLSTHAGHLLDILQRSAPDSA